MKKLFKDPKVQLAILIFLIVLCAYAIGFIMGSDSGRAPIVIEKVNP